MVRVLFVDDDPSLCKAVARRLRRAQLDVTTVGGGVAAIEELSQASYDGVVCHLAQLLSEAARLLHISRSTLVDKLKRFELIR